MGGSVFLDLMGGVALLLWGLHMVHSGIVRAFGADLRRGMAHAFKNRVTAFLAGVGVTALLQSSTATALLASSFSASRLLPLVPALAVMLGANVGTTVVVQLLSFDISAVAPLLLLGGYITFKRAGRTRSRDVGRVAIGLGLMLLALHILLGTLAPAENAPAMRLLIGEATTMPALGLAVGAVLTVATHSSVAVVLLVMSLAFSNFIAPVGALALVLGANLGSAIVPLLGGHGHDPAARRLPIGNLINRVVGCALALPLLPEIVHLLEMVEGNPVRLAADFHTGFNVVMALLFILPLGPFARLLERLLPAREDAQDPGSPIYLDQGALNSPPVALACAARETLRVGDLVETMLRQSLTVFQTDDRKLAADTSRMDDAVDRLHEAVKFYITRLTSESLDEAEARRAMEIVTFAVNLEHVGDIIDKNLMELAQKKIKNRLHFSKEGMAEIEAFHKRVTENLKLAFSIFITADVKVARQLIQEKADLRGIELSVAENHFGRLRQGLSESIETSSLHLDVLRDLKRIHSHVCSVAYPVLENSGDLSPSRLRVAVVERAEEGMPRTAP